MQEASNYHGVGSNHDARQSELRASGRRLQSAESALAVKFVNVSLSDIAIVGRLHGPLAVPVRSVFLLLHGLTT